MKAAQKGGIDGMTQGRASIRIAQIDVETTAPFDNLAKMEGIIREHREADLIVFPELTVHGHLISPMTKQEILNMLARAPTDYRQRLHACAREMQTNVMFGEIGQVAGKLYNLAVFVSPEGIDWYAKTHVHWTEEFDPGAEFRVFDCAFARLGPLICFDSAFPEAARVLALRGATVIVTIAAVPTSFDMQFMHRRAGAIALNNQVFSVLANRTGAQFGGRSAVFDPRGDVLALAGHKEEVLNVTIDLGDLERWRRDEPLHQHRRPALYGPLAGGQGAGPDGSCPPPPVGPQAGAGAGLEKDQAGASGCRPPWGD